ncbi:hypothetical protein NKR23_g8557 [Pleurostoma richardsiae]|uniref:Uncharacterized protein n=1 Tax=Pleurostoma richardsiae TaxID=41990 RepID=A0AA38RT35_9PEZI|nr:hypothetical protein NKR23_g8557 [Pleurostoma richardsiae]
MEREDSLLKNLTRDNSYTKPSTAPKDVEVTTTNVSPTHNGPRNDNTSEVTKRTMRLTQGDGSAKHQGDQVQHSDQHKETASGQEPEHGDRMSNGLSTSNKNHKDVNTVAYLGDGSSAHGLKSDNNRLDREGDEADQMTHDYEVKLQAAHNSIAQYEVLLKDSTEEVEQLKRQKLEMENMHEARINEMAAANEELNAQYQAEKAAMEQTHQARINEMTATNAKLKARQKSDIQDTLKKLEDKLNEAKDVNIELGTKYRTLFRERENMHRVRIDDMTATNTQLKAHCQAVKTAMEQAHQARINEMAAAHAKMKAQHQDENVSMQTKYQKYISEMTSARTQLQARYQARISEMEKVNADLKRENEELSGNK